MRALTFSPGLGRLLALAGILVLTSCGNDKRHSAEKALHQVGGLSLRREAATFYKELFVAPTGTYFIPKVDTWPATFRRLNPLSVRAYPDGFSLAILDERGGEEGLHIMPAGMDSQPREGRTSRFQKIDEGIYWYSFSEKQGR